MKYCSFDRRQQMNERMNQSTNTFSGQPCTENGKIPDENHVSNTSSSKNEKKTQTLDN